MYICSSTQFSSIGKLWIHSTETGLGKTVLVWRSLYYKLALILQTRFWRCYCFEYFSSDFFPTIIWYGNQHLYMFSVRFHSSVHLEEYVALVQIKQKLQQEQKQQQKQHDSRNHHGKVVFLLRMVVVSPSWCRNKSHTHTQAHHQHQKSFSRFGLGLSFHGWI